jgi:hypothetical protein
MDHFWKWLMRTDARSIFVAALLLFILVTGWLVWGTFQPRAAVPPTPVATESVKLTSFRPLGVMNLISNQFSAQTLVVPVNPFRPTFEAMVRNPESGDWQSIANVKAVESNQQKHADRQQGSDTHADRTRHGPRGNGDPDPANADPGPPPIPQFAFKGMFQRPDGRIAAYVGSTVGGGRFLAVGDRLEGFEVVDASAEGVTLRMADGTKRVLAKGDGPVALGDE